jgi:ATP-dependent Clp protease ATP-binding subunit ClpA
MFTRLSHGARAVLAQAEREARGLGHPFVGTEHLLLGILATRPASAADVQARPGSATDMQAQSASGAELTSRRSSAGGAAPSAPGPGAFAMLAAAGVRYDEARVDVVRLGTRGEGLGPADADALQAIGIDIEAVRARVEEIFGVGALDPPTPRSRPGFLGFSRRRRAPAGLTGRRLFTARMRRIFVFCVREASRREDRQISTELLLLGIIREGRGLASRVLTGRGVDVIDLGTRIESGLPPRRDRHGVSS